MEKLELTLESENRQTVRFVTPVALLLTGFKFSYVSPEKLEEQIFEICAGDRRFKNNVKSNCLEEGLLNFPERDWQVVDESYSLTISRKK